MNTTADRTFALKPPVGIAGARNLASRETVSFAAPVSIAPLTTLALLVEEK